MAIKKIKAEIENENGESEIIDLNEKATVRVEIKKFPVEKARIKIVGDTPLLVHAWSEKVKKELLANMQMTKLEKKAKDHERKDPFADFVEAAYWVTDMPEVRGLPPEEQIAKFERAIEDGAQFGFPTIAFKKSAVMAAKSAGIITNMKLMSRLFHVNAINSTHKGSSLELAILNIEEPPELSEDVVQVGFPKKADLRYRPCFRKWSVELELTLIKTGMFTMEDIINAIDMSGFMNGVGEWRIERDGEFGSYHVQIGG